jgi:drug/metabolite transporter (DMT)-like permease
MGTVGHFLLILAYKRAPAATLTPYLYTQIALPCWAAGWCLPTCPTSWSLMGIALVAVCGAAGAWLTVRESRVRVEPVES